MHFCFVSAPRLGWTFHDGRDFHSWSSLHSPGTEWMLSTNMLTEGTKSPFWAQHPRLSFGEPPSCTLYSQAMNEGSPHPLHRGPLLRLGSLHIQDHWLHLGRWYPHKGLKSLPLKLESWHKRKGLLPRERGTLPNWHRSTSGGSPGQEQISSPWPQCLGQRLACKQTGPARWILEIRRCHCYQQGLLTILGK